MIQTETKPLRCTGATLLMRHTACSMNTVRRFIRGERVSLDSYTVLAPLAERLGIQFVRQDGLRPYTQNGVSP